MRTAASILLIVFSTTVAANPEQVVESRTYDVQASKAEIIKRGQACLSQILRYESFGQYAAGPVIVSTNDDSIVANSRLVMRGKMLLPDEVLQSHITFLVRDGQFKIRHNDVVWGFADGNHRLESVHPKAKAYRTNEQRLGELDDKIAECVAKPSDW